MNKVYRHSMKARMVGNSLGMTIPVRMRYKWSLEPGEQLATYQIDDLLVVLPLRYLPQQGEHKLLELLRQAVDPTAP